MKVAIITPSLQMGGAERSLVKLTQVISPMLQKVIVLCMASAGTAFSTELPTNTDLIVLGTHSSANPITWLKVYIKLRKLHPDLVIGWSTYANIVTMLVTRWLPKCKVVLSERNYIPKMFGRDNATPIRRRIVLELIKRLYRRADIVTANSSMSIRCLKRYIGNGPAYNLIPNMINHGEIKQRAKFPKQPLLPEIEGPKILAVGRLDYQKGFDILLDAMCLVRACCPWSLVIVGDGPQKRALLRKTEDLGLAGHVHWVGAMLNPFPFYSWADMVVVPSRFEGFPNVALEAMAMGRAVICSDCDSGPGELTHKGQFGVLVPTGDGKALADAIIKLGFDPDRRKCLGENARHHVLENYEAKVIQKRYLQALGIE